MAWNVSPGFLTQARFLGDARALSSFPEKSWGEERARCSKPACGRPGRWRGGVGYFSREGSPGSSPRLKRRALAGVGCGERGGRHRDRPRQGNLRERTSLSTPAVPSGKCSPTRELRSRKRGTAGRDGSPGRRRGESAVAGSTFSQQQPQTYKVLLTAPLLRLPPPD